MTCVSVVGLEALAWSAGGAHQALGEELDLAGVKEEQPARAEPRSERWHSAAQAPIAGRLLRTGCGARRRRCR